MNVSTATDLPVRQETRPGRPLARISILAMREARRDSRLMRAVAALTEAGYDVSIVDIEMDARRPPIERHNGARLQHMIIPDWLASKRFEPLFFLNAVRALVTSTLRLVRNNADIYHASDVNALLASYFAAIIRRKPLVFDVYDLQFPVPETEVRFWRRAGWLVTLFHRIILPRCERVFVTSPLHAEEIRRHFHFQRITLLRNIPPWKSVQRSNRLRDFLGLPDSTRIALYQGGLQPDRELDRLVRAARYLKPDTVIVMMGSGIEPTLSQLHALIASEGVSDRVKIIPPVPYEELLDWTASADIGMIIYSRDYSPNVRMCLPNKLFEFLMAGLPLLASQLDAVAEIVTTRQVGRIVPSLAPQDIAEAISALLDDREALAAMRARALAAAHQDYHWEKESQQLLNIYQQILQEPV